MNKYLVIFTSMVFLLSSCLKDEFLAFPEGTPKTISVSPQEIALLVGETAQVVDLEFSGLSTEEQNGSQNWLSSDATIASVNDGVITGVSEGQAFIWLNVSDVESDSVLVTVVSSANSVAQVEILNVEFSLSKDSSLQFLAQATTVNGNIIPNSNISWSSSNNSLASIDSFGVLTAHNIGLVNVTANVNGIASLPYTIQITSGVGSLSRTGTFSGNANYTAQGTATLTQVDINTLELTFDSNFSVSTGPGLYVYLATTNSGTISNGGNGLRISDLLSGSDFMGARTYTISTSDVMLNDFDFVVLYCEPFGLPFGSAVLN